MSRNPTPPTPDLDRRARLPSGGLRAGRPALLARAGRLGAARRDRPAARRGHAISARSRATASISTTARTCRASCRRCSTSRIRFRRRTASRSARRASIARCAPPTHFAHFAGSEAKIQLACRAPAADRASARTSRASCTGVDATARSTIDCDGQTFQLPIDDIDHAKLVPDWDAVMHGKSGVGAAERPSRSSPGTGRARSTSRSTEARERS